MVEQPEIHRKSRSKKVEERKGAARQLGEYFAILEDKEQAWDDLHKLTQDKNDYVRGGAASALGSAYSHILDKHKQQAWEDLRKLTQDNDRDLRIAANHSSGRASIFRATNAISEDKFRGELEKALEFFEKASKEANEHENPQIIFNQMRTAGAQYIWEFYVNDLQKPKTDAINWHGQYTSQWLYAGCILLEDNKVSTHH